MSFEVLLQSTKYGMNYFKNWNCNVNINFLNNEKSGFLSNFYYLLIIVMSTICAGYLSASMFTKLLKLFFTKNKEKQARVMYIYILQPVIDISPVIH